MKRKILVFALLLSLVITLIPTSNSMFGATSASPDTGWTLVTDAREMKGYPDLREYVWQKNASMAPNGQYDKIGLHRLVKTGITPIGVIFMTDCPNWGAGEQHISNPPTDTWTKYENYSSAIYWANRGFDVYAIDYRTHFVPKDLNASQMSFAANWGWDVWISDIKEAANKVKEVSGSKKFFMEGQCSGGEAALNYATKYWKDDLSGIVLLDAFYPGASGYPIVGRIAETNTYNMTKAISNMNTEGNWSSESLRNLRPVASYALQNPDAPAAYPPGTPLNPPLNPITNKTWANITEWFTWRVQNNFGSTTTPPGIFSNLLGGYGNISQDEYCLANNEFLPVRLFIENAAMADWVNCPDLSYDFNDHYNEIGVPVLAFEGPYVNQTGKFKFVQGTNNTDFTGNWMSNYGHLDIFFGTYSARDISEPAYQWMINHSPSGWSLVTDARAMKAYPDLKEYVWQKNASMAPNGIYDKIGLHRLIKSGIIPKGVVFITTGTSCNGAEQIISNPPTENFTLTENYSIPIYWANRGFDVYSIDYRTHFVPVTLNLNETIFMANWGYDQWISDTKEAVDKVKEVSGASKIFLASFGYNFAMFYASKFWKQDLQGILLLDTASPSKGIGTNTYNLTDKLSQMSKSGSYGVETLGSGTPTTPGAIFVFRYALQNPDAPAAYPPGTPLSPPLNPITNKTWANITEWFQVMATSPSVCNIAGGNGNVTAYIRWIATMDRYWPYRIQYEAAAINDWTNCPYVAYDYDDHFKEIDVPLISYQSGLYGAKTINITNGIANADFTSIVLPTYGKVDIYSGINTARDVSEPAIQWMINHSYPTIIFSNGFEDGFNSWTATQGGASIVTSPVHSGNYAMKCSNPWGSQATKSIAAQGKTYAEAQFYFSQDFAGSQSLIAFFDANGNPTVEMGLSVQSGKLFAYVQTNLPSYSYSQYPLLGLLPETWYKFALDASETSATIYLDDQQIADTNLPNIPATSSVGVGMFWGDGSYKGNLYIDSVQIADCAPKPVSASVFASGFEDGFNSWNKTYGGALVVSSPVYFGNYSMKCSGPMGSQATKSIGMQSGTLAEAEFYFDGNIAGSQTLIAYFNAKGGPSVSMGLSVQEGKVFAFVQSMLPSYSYSQYELTGFTSGTWTKFALDVSATSATIYMYDQKLTSISQTNIPAAASVGVGMFWTDGNYKGNLYIDSVQIGTLPPLALPEGANGIEYCTGGIATVNVPSPVPFNYPPSATMMKIEVFHVEIPNDNIEFNIMDIMIFTLPPGGTTRVWTLYAYITTSPQDAAFAKKLWSGTYVEMPGPYYSSSWVTTDNVKLVSDSVLQVERHGNNIYVNLGAPQPIERPNGGGIYFDIPAFSMELKSFGESIHASGNIVATGYYDASGYTVGYDIMGFRANGAFTSSAWGCNGAPVSDGTAYMHEIITYYPPTPPV